MVKSNSECKRHLHVAVGVILRGQRVLLTKRPAGKPHAGLWEFPGGKCEPGESVRQALVRELAEELGVVVLAATPMVVVNHDYDNVTVDLDVWQVSAYLGEPAGQEGQQCQWVPLAKLPDYDFPAANHEIINYLKELRMAAN